ncbi:capsular biosynthesis protein [Pseudoalteromonas sp. S16_S37]|uniref:capsular biosynthesis protein n=1 Tax=Pseudoalteromonas sp. S16_S37 TaxID=2720228 RepID=UPI0016808FEF|nr:capsular biosynthesis protein [Pseudoalteromonas sp. S16_S37]MBD1582155.1 CpsD/CapB family tyrosine-protein kinase [Pseudoalteromonas sp. S16_S37]
MKTIPYQFQELETVCNEITNQKANCVTFLSLTGNGGASSLCKSVAAGLKAERNRVLVIDLNPLNPMPVPQGADAQYWQFDDISCQLCVIEGPEHDFLTISHLAELESAKNKLTMQYAIERLRQEYDYVLIDMSPAMKLNKGNVPLHALSSCSQMTILIASLGHNDEEALCIGLKHLRESGHKTIRVVVSQHHFEPLGERVMRQLYKHKARWPRLTRWLGDKLQRQAWLFHNH